MLVQIFSRLATERAFIEKAVQKTDVPTENHWTFRLGGKLYLIFFQV